MQVKYSLIQNYYKMSGAVSKISSYASANWKLLSGVALFASFDVFWFLRFLCSSAAALFRRRDDSLSADSSVLGICWTTDIDYFLHMNNGRYLREMDFGRFNFYFRTGSSESESMIYALTLSKIFR